MHTEFESEKVKGKILGTSSRRWEYNIKMNFSANYYDDVDWVNFT